MCVGVLCDELMEAESECNRTCREQGREGKRLTGREKYEKKQGGNRRIVYSLAGTNGIGKI